MSYELKPIDGRKSFYKKAIVHVNEDGTATLSSYGTPVIRRNADGTLTRLWGGVECNNWPAYRRVLRTE